MDTGRANVIVRIRDARGDFLILERVAPAEPAQTNDDLLPNISVEGEAQARSAGHVAGHIGLANLNGVETLDRRERTAPGRAVVDRVLDERAGLDAGEVRAPLLV